MADALARQRRAGRRSVHARFEANRDFHLALVGAAGNAFLDQLAGVLWVARIGEAIYEAQGQPLSAGSSTPTSTRRSSPPSRAANGAAETLAQAAPRLGDQTLGALSGR